jgi:3-oxoacyl-[acyl-carrier protein] reductase
LAREGVNVGICARTKDSLDLTTSDLKEEGIEAVGVVADVTDPSALDPLHKRIMDTLGPLDILVNNVGGGRPGGEIQATTEAHFREAFERNLFGAYGLMKRVIPHMRQQRWGRIINIASIWGREYGGVIGYMSAKAALIAATKHAAVSLAKDGVLLNSVAPGSISHPGGSWETYQREETSEVVQEFIDRNMPMGRFGWPEPVGDLVAFLASERASLITGASINVDGAQSRSLI